MQRRQHEGAARGIEGRGVVDDAVEEAVVLVGEEDAAERLLDEPRAARRGLAHRREVVRRSRVACELATVARVRSHVKCRKSFARTSLPIVFSR